MRKLILIFVVVAIASTNSQGQLLNGDFEEVILQSSVFTNDSVISPNHWYFTDDTGSRITDHSFSGNYAIEIWSWYYGQSNSGIIYGSNFPNRGQPFFERPSSLTGYYKFDNVNSLGEEKDFGIVVVYLTKFNENLNKRDTIGFGQFLFPESKEFVFFECEINYNSFNLPDTILLAFKSSHNEWTNCDKDGNGNCNFLSIDNLSFQTYNTTSTNTLKSDFGIEIYPNPNTDILKIRVGDFLRYEISIFSTNGKLLYQDTLFEFKEISINDFKCGIYFVQIQNEYGNSITKKIIKE